PGKGDLQGFFVLDLVILALGRNAPAAQCSNLAAWIKRNCGNAVVSPAGPKDLVNRANPGLDLIDRLDVDHTLGIEEHGVGFVIMGGKGRRYDGMHPGRGVSRQTSQRAGENARANIEECPHPVVSCWPSTHPVEA